MPSCCRDLASASGSNQVAPGCGQPLQSPTADTLEISAQNIASIASDPQQAHGAAKVVVPSGDPVGVTYLDVPDLDEDPGIVKVTDQPGRF
jgi:hypothetical protein